MYRERRSRLDGAVVWESEVSARSHQRVMPDGCMDLIWTSGGLLVAGPDTRTHHDRAAPGTRYVGLRFPPGTGPAVLGVPADELRDLRVALDDLWPDPLVRRLGDRFDDAHDLGAALEAVAAHRLAESEGPDPQVTAAVQALADGESVAAVADEVGLSERQLHRRFLTACGYGPKMLARVLRFRRALGLAGEGTPFAQVAARAGYADQAHLAREVKDLTGEPLGRLV